MMRGPKLTTMAVRRLDGSIYTETTENSEPTIWNKIPFVRGVVSFVQSMTNGSKQLMRSADIAIEDEERMEAEKLKKQSADTADEAAIAPTECADAADEAAAAPTECADTADEAAADAPKTTPEEWLNPHAAQEPTESAAVPTAKASKKSDKKKGGDSDTEGWTFLSVVLGVCLAMLLFVFLPTWGYTWILKIPGAADIFGGKVWKSVIEGFIRIVIFILYILLCTTMKEIRRVFEYHGAEHKTIFCYEAGEELTVENVKKYKRFHPRCGTSFIVLTVLVGILSGICISVLFPSLDNTWLRPVIKLLMLPIVMGVGYELLKLCGKYDNLFTRIIRAPGLWVQRITTREPDDGQIECAIAALIPVIPEDGEDMQ